MPHEPQERDYDSRFNRMMNSISYCQHLIQKAERLTIEALGRMQHRAEVLEMIKSRDFVAYVSTKEDEEELLISALEKENAGIVDEPEHEEEEEEEIVGDSTSPLRRQLAIGASTQTTVHFDKKEREDMVVATILTAWKEARGKIAEVEEYMYGTSAPLLADLQMLLQWTKKAHREIRRFFGPNFRMPPVPPMATVDAQTEQAEEAEAELHIAKRMLRKAELAQMESCEGDAMQKYYRGYVDFSAYAGPVVRTSTTQTGVLEDTVNVKVKELHEVIEALLFALRDCSNGIWGSRFKISSQKMLFSIAHVIDMITTDATNISETMEDVRSRPLERNAKTRRPCVEKSVGPDEPALLCNISVNTIPVVVLDEKIVQIRETQTEEVIVLQPADIPVTCDARSGPDEMLSDSDVQRNQKNMQRIWDLEAEVKQLQGKLEESIQTQRKLELTVSAKQREVAAVERRSSNLVEELKKERLSKGDLEWELDETKSETENLSRRLTMVQEDVSKFKKLSEDYKRKSIILHRSLSMSGSGSVPENPFTSNQEYALGDEEPLKNRGDEENGGLLESDVESDTGNLENIQRCHSIEPSPVHSHKSVHFAVAKEPEKPKVVLVDAEVQVMPSIDTAGTITDDPMDNSVDACVAAIASTKTSGCDAIPELLEFLVGMQLRNREDVVHRAVDATAEMTDQSCGYDETATTSRYCGTDPPPEMVDFEVQMSTVVTRTQQASQTLATRMHSRDCQATLCGCVADTKKEAQKAKARETTVPAAPPMADDATVSSVPAQPKEVSEEYVQTDEVETEETSTNYEAMGVAEFSCQFGFIPPALETHFTQTFIPQSHVGVDAAPRCFDFCQQFAPAQILQNCVSTQVELSTEDAAIQSISVVGYRQRSTQTEEREVSVSAVQTIEELSPVARKEPRTAKVSTQTDLDPREGGKEPSAATPALQPNINEGCQCNILSKPSTENLGVQTESGQSAPKVFASKGCQKDRDASTERTLCTIAVATERPLVFDVACQTGEPVSDIPKVLEQHQQHPHPAAAGSLMPTSDLERDVPSSFSNTRGTQHTSQSTRHSSPFNITNPRDLYKRSFDDTSNLLHEEVQDMYPGGAGSLEPVGSGPHQTFGVDPGGTVDQAASKGKRTVRMKPKTIIVQQHSASPNLEERKPEGGRRHSVPRILSRSPEATLEDASVIHGSWSEPFRTHSKYNTDPFLHNRNHVIKPNDLAFSDPTIHEKMGGTLTGPAPPVCRSLFRKVEGNQQKIRALGRQALPRSLAPLDVTVIARDQGQPLPAFYAPSQGEGTPE